MVSPSRKKRTCEQNDHRLRVGVDFTYILYGPNEIFLQDGQLKLNIRNRIYKPIIRMEGDRIIVEVGGDGVLGVGSRHDVYS